MAFTLHQVGVGTAQRVITNLIAISDKGAAHCAANKIAEADMLAYRLAPDMFPLAKQAANVSRQVYLLGLIVGREPPAAEAECKETSFAEVKARLGRALDFAGSLPADQIAASEDKQIVWTPAPNYEMKFTGTSLVMNFMLPNIWFHATTAYDILRHAGVPLGKRDFLGQI
jgi:hypothetical protein